MLVFVLLVLVLPLLVLLLLPVLSVLLLLQHTHLDSALLLIACLLPQQLLRSPVSVRCSHPTTISSYRSCGSRLLA